MIVNKSLKGLHIIFHEAHGLLAGKIGYEISQEFRTINWFETLIAICEHDDRQLNFKEKNYLSEIGLPLDFTEEEIKVEEVIIRMNRVLKSSSNKSLWVKLLISYHLEFIYSELRENSKQIRKFFIKEEESRQQLLKHFNISDKKGRAIYEYLRFCDRLSLILCKDEAPDAGRLLEINTSINEETYFIKKTKDNEMIISPWIFTSSQFELSIEERVLKETQFTSSKQFEKALLAVQPELKKWIIKKDEQ